MLYYSLFDNSLNIFLYRLLIFHSLYHLFYNIYIKNLTITLQVADQKQQKKIAIKKKSEKEEIKKVQTCSVVSQTLLAREYTGILRRIFFNIIKNIFK